jgi:hypothetical protein
VNLRDTLRLQAGRTRGIPPVVVMLVILGAAMLLASGGVFWVSIRMADQLSEKYGSLLQGKSGVPEAEAASTPDSVAHQDLCDSVDIGAALHAASKYLTSAGVGWNPALVNANAQMAQAHLLLVRTCLGF